MSPVIIQPFMTVDDLSIMTVLKGHSHEYLT